MDYQIQRLSIHAEHRRSIEPAIVFLHYWGSGISRTSRKVVAELDGRFMTVAYDARGIDGRPKARRKLKTAPNCRA
jgi:hypothetical protein